MSDRLMLLEHKCSDCNVVVLNKDDGVVVSAHGSALRDECVSLKRDKHKQAGSYDM